LTNGGNQSYNDNDESINLNRYKSLLYLLQEFYGHKILEKTYEACQSGFHK